MDRLPTLIALAGATALGATLMLGACDAKTEPAAVPPRTNGAKVATGQASSTEAFCDVHADDERGAAFHWPDVTGGSAPGKASGWRWVNVWATWCKPCVAEMPRLVAEHDKLAAAGKQVELTFVSVDDSDADITAFRKDHPGTPPSLRIANSDQRAGWLRSLGLGDGAIPIHLFVSPANKLRCARAGEVREQDLATVDKLFGE